MDFNAILLTSALWIVIFRVVSQWKAFSMVRSVFPKFVDDLWKGWTISSFCGGFWVALGVRYFTNWHTINLFLHTHDAVIWALDGMVTALGVLVLIRVVDALGSVGRGAPKTN